MIKLKVRTEAAITGTNIRNIQTKLVNIIRINIRTEVVNMIKLCIRTEAAITNRLNVRTEVVNVLRMNIKDRLSECNESVNTDKRGEYN
jgi:hypothetical protein